MSSSGERFSVLDDPCCLGIHIPGIDEDEDDGETPVVAAATADAIAVTPASEVADASVNLSRNNDNDNDGGVIAPVVYERPPESSAATAPYDEEQDGFSEAHDAEEQQQHDGMMRPKILFEHSRKKSDVSRDTVIQHSIASKGQETYIDPQQTNDDNDDKTSVFWVRLRQKRCIFLLLLNFFFLIVFIFLVAKYAGKKRSSNESSATTTASSGVDQFDDENQSEDTNSTEVDTSSASLLPAHHPCNTINATREDGVVFSVNETLTAGEYACSPEQKFIFGVTPLPLGELILVKVDTNDTVWTAGIMGADRFDLLPDGNMVGKDAAGEILWSTEVVGFPKSDDPSPIQLIISDDGILSIQQENENENDGTLLTTLLWLDGAPEKKRLSSEDLSFPVRGTFYYSIYNGEESWDDTRHEPVAGYYSSSDPAVVRKHVDALSYGKFDLAISSWTGQEMPMHRPRTKALLDETSQQDTSLKWTFNYELNRSEEPTAEGIEADLKYLQSWFTWHDSWAYIDGKPLLFVNNLEGCDDAERWMQAAGNEWFIVLRVFRGFKDCSAQPSSWHVQRANEDGNGVDVFEGYCHNLAPGEWRAGRNRPDFDRLSKGRWCNNVWDMVNSDLPWKLVVSFNEAAAGTSVESSWDWESDSGYGDYLDCLHNDGRL